MILRKRLVISSTFIKIMCTTTSFDGIGVGDESVENGTVEDGGLALVRQSTSIVTSLSDR